MGIARTGSRRVAVMLIALLVLSVAPLPAAAQDGLDDEELALIDRVIAALETADSSNYTATAESQYDSEWTATLGGEFFSATTESATIQTNEMVINTPDGLNFQRQVTVNGSYEISDVPPGSLTLDGEIRLVDGTVYARAAYADPNPDLQPIPTGWTPITPADLNVWPGLNMLNEPAWLFDENRDQSSVRDYGMSRDDLAAMFTETALSVSLETDTLPDGTPVDVITIVLGPESMALMVDETADDPIGNLLFESATDASTRTFRYMVDENDTIRVAEYVDNFEVVDLDITELAQAPEQVLLNMTTRSTNRVEYSAIDGDPVLIEAPDLPVVVVPEATAQPWWNDRVFYEVFVRSFYDSDGDGIGDINGLIEKLDYLNDGDPATTDDLGITGIWLMPVAQSPSYHGYDVMDYYTIEQDYGTNADFQRLMEEAHSRGIVVIVDLVLNHTSVDHPWFLAAQAGDPQYEDYYIWTDDPPGYNGPWGQQVWHTSGDRYYFGLFWEGMPDLNYENPVVTDEMYDVIAFWLDDLGADGFRLDAIRHLDEDGPIMENTPQTLAWLEDFHVYVHTLNPDALTVGEIWDSSDAVVPYVGDRVDIAFEFDLAGAILDSVRFGSSNALVRQMSEVLALYPDGQYAVFLTNHDQNRVMSQLGDTDKARVAATILLTSPGVPFIYYGEEVGMVGTKPDPEIRTPMQWDVWDTTGGFTLADEPWEPMAANYQENNVALQTFEPDSLLTHYRSLIHLRTAHTALRTGAMLLVESSDTHLYSFVRYDADETLLIVVNLSRNPVEDYTLSLDAGPLIGGENAAVLYGPGPVAAPQINASGGFADYVPLERIPAFSSIMIQLE
ncbi:MAG: DUF3459 domain-containing protein [Chloroflexi bacterium]|nr:DUF3459 domain-containing protein [Chloroflexota bacterium]